MCYIRSNVKPSCYRPICKISLKNFLVVLQTPKNQENYNTRIIMATHPAVVTVAAGAPLEIHQVPTPVPKENEIKVRVEWTASTPLDLHQADGGLLVKHPLVLGDGAAGTVESVGPSASIFKPGDKVFGFGWRTQAEKAHQHYAVAPENLWAKLPEGFTMQEAVTLPNNFVTVYHTFTHDFGFDLPWPKPDGYVPREADDLILIWGASSSCGMYGIQVLKYFGYNHIVAVASKSHHEKLEEYGAVKCFDYRTGDVVGAINDYAASQGKQFNYIFDCIGSLKNSVEPVSRIAKAGAKVPILLPVIIKDAAKGVRPEYEMEVTRHTTWASGVEPIGVRTHFYLDNKFLAQHLQTDIMPDFLARKVVRPNDQVIVEGATLLERAEKALSMLRDKQVSGGRLVWRVVDSE